MIPNPKVTLHWQSSVQLLHQKIWLWDVRAVVLGLQKQARTMAVASLVCWLEEDGAVSRISAGRESRGGWAPGKREHCSFSEPRPTGTVDTLHLALRNHPQRIWKLCLSWMQSIRSGGIRKCVEGLPWRKKANTSYQCLVEPVPCPWVCASSDAMSTQTLPEGW